MAMKVRQLQPEQDRPGISGGAPETNTLISEDTRKYLDGLLEASTMAKQQSPYGPQFPMLAKYFKAK